MGKVIDSYWIETYGCEMNKAESNALEKLLIQRGYKRAENPMEASLAILNTCSVRITAENRIWGRLGYYQALKNKTDIKVILVGCMAERLKDVLIRESKSVDYVISNFSKMKFYEVLDKIGINTHQYIEGEEEYSFFTNHHKADDFKSFIPIMHGCNNFCSYCIVPYVRGREISRTVPEILNELASLEREGVKEITLLGQNVNSYKSIWKGKHYRFSDLLLLISESIEKIRWIRFLTSHPKDFTEDIIKVLTENPVFCRFIHLPVQSGSDKILNSMRRAYTREHYIDLIKKIRSSMPSVNLSTDILVGFPGETEDDFNETLSLIKEIRYNEAFMYYYNPREGTKAFDFPDSLSEEIKLNRLNRLIALQNVITKEEKRKKIGSVMEVLVEGISKKDESFLIGRSESNEMVVFPAKTKDVGEFIKVRIDDLSGNTFVGSLYF